ncbi:MFS transporter [Pseudoalteromonas phenolica]|uniref:MFS transporter n=1 Tax=Pseudoalteromonas phenolica TaxID=161398 RepID=UPI00384C4F36
MSRLVTLAAISACYFIFAILLNSVGTVILQSINSFEISKVQASTLEGFKDLPIAIVSFLVAAYIPRIGYKVALLVGLIAVTAASIATPLIANFMVIKLLFASIGAAFALVKVSVYSIIGQISDSEKSHSSTLNTVEGIFMVGSLTGYWLFSYFIDTSNLQSLSWLNVYYVLAAMLVITAALVVFAPIKPVQQASRKTHFTTEFIAMLKMSYQPLALIFIVSVFLYVLIEQGISTWLPTFNREILLLPVDISVQMTSIFAASLAVGRLLAGQILKHVNWYRFLQVCILGMAALIIGILPLTQGIEAREITNLSSLPLAAYLLPLIGLLMAPIYPVLNSIMLSSLETEKHAPMTGLIVVFSALGGTTGSIITGSVFEFFDGQTAFYLSLIPMLGVFLALRGFRTVTARVSQ